MWQSAGMIDTALSRTIRIRVYQDSVRDLGRTFRLSTDADPRGALRQAVLAAVPRNEGWTLQLFTLERTNPGERVAALLAAAGTARAPRHGAG